MRALDETTRAALGASGDPQEIVHRYTAPWEDLRYFPLAHYLQELVEVTRPLPPPASVRASALALLSNGVTFTDAATMRAWASGFPSARAQAIEAYHWPLTERPVEVRLAIERFCEGLAPQRA